MDHNILNEYYLIIILAINKFFKNIFYLIYFYSHINNKSKKYIFILIYIIYK